MATRLERIVALLETGSSPAIRQTAAKQLGDIARRFFPTVECTVDGIKREHVHGTRPQAIARYKYEEGWRSAVALVYRILPFLASKSMDTRLAAVNALNHIAEAVPLWYPELPSPEHPPPTQNPSGNPELKQLEALDIEAIVESGCKLGTAGRMLARDDEKAPKSYGSATGPDDAFLHNLGIDSALIPKGESLSDVDVDDELMVDVKPETGKTNARRPAKAKRPASKASSAQDVKAEERSRKRIKLESTPEPPKQDANQLMGSDDPPQSVQTRRPGRPKGSKSKTYPASLPSSPSRNSTVKDDDMFRGLSGRQVLVLKRKLKTNSVTVEQANEEAKKMRSGSEANSTTNSPGDADGINSVDVNTLAEYASDLGARTPPAEMEVIKSETDPSSLVNGSQNGVASSTTAPAFTDLPEVDHRRSIWTPIIHNLATQLRQEAWEIRHGSSLALKDLIRTHGESYGMEDNLTTPQNSRARERALDSVAAALLEMLAQDRFGDFIGDQVIAPVREAGSQALASLMRHLEMGTIENIHSTLLKMILQDWSARKIKSSKNAKGRYVWEMRHAGLLGLKYELAVRPDLITEEKAEQHVGSQTYIEGVLQGSLLGLADSDDDVRAVAAACLLPVAEEISSRLPKPDLENLLEVLWNTFLDESDELNSSIASVMALLSRLLAAPKVIDLYAEMQTGPRSLRSLIPRLYPYFRHTISTVRMSVVQTIYTFLRAERLSREWITPQTLHLIFRNILLEERQDVRDLSIRAWNHVIGHLDNSGLYPTCVQPYIQEWFNLALIPAVDGYTSLAFAKADTGTRRSVDAHDVDKAMMASDFSLIDEDLVLRNRLEAAEALTQVARCGHADRIFEQSIFSNLLSSFLLSTSAHQLILCGVFVQEWSQATGGHTVRFADRVPESGQVISALANLTERQAPEAYYEVMKDLAAIQQEAETLRLLLENATSTTKFSPQVEVIDKLSLADIKQFLASTFDHLLSKSTRRSAMRQQLIDRKVGLETALLQYERSKDKLDNRVSTSAAAAIFSMKVTPPRLNPIIQNVMKGIKNEKNIDMQARAAKALAIFIDNCLDPTTPLAVNPVAKIIGNLASLICQDPSRSPSFPVSSGTPGIYALEEERKAVEVKKAATKVTQTVGVTFDEKEDATCASVGAERAFAALCEKFQDDIFDKLPRLLEIVYTALSSKKDFNHLSTQEGQDIIDSLAVLQVVLPHLSEGVNNRIATLLPFILGISCSSYGVLRNCAAKTLAIACKVMPKLGMLFVIENVIPLLGDASSEINRSGGIEAIYYIVNKLEINVLPYILFMVIPVLGRMTDSSTDIRLLASNVFAALVKIMPLEEGIPDPEGLPARLLSQRETEREFLQQLLNNRKIEPYEMPVPIKADLRPYQRDGVSWLAFLAKYQLHGILCDDMGLGKSIQTICIIASKHQERRARFEASGAKDARPIPSLIVCPPTLIGHWYHEILKFTDNLKPFKYFGSTKDREGLRREMTRYDVVITSYEVIRADIEALKRVPFLYCVLDEGHIVKNGKSKLSMAIKAIQSNHRLILSGTPIQNNVLELWNLFDFLMPGFLGSEKQFNDKFSKPILANRDGKATARQSEAATLALDALHKQVLPFLLRRLKEDVLDDLPPKIIQDYYCDLSSVQRLLYEEFNTSRAAKETQDEVIASVGTEDVVEPQRHVFQTLQFLRKLCNHPLLAVNQDVALYRRKVEEAWAKDKDHTPKDPNDIAHCPKLVALQQLLLDCGIGHVAGDSFDTADIDTTANHRVLIFAQTKQMLDVIQNELFNKLMPSVSFMRLDGSTEALSRHDIVQTFNNDPSIDVLLLTTSVGGLGLTLTGADTVIFMDHDWNPQKDAQAMDRAHRIGQKKVVNVYRLITRGTLEEKIMSLQKFKLNIANTVVNERNSGLESMNTDQVLDLFSADTGAPNQPGNASGGGVSGKSHVLEGLQDLPAQEEYENLSLDNFLSKY